ncbi:MAG TPA: 3-hydroxyacyl-CoA dehydrogenase family protein [Chitinophagaceae bacterium]|nr:3-hydroxyacyl-CoA dehydrogenase family protein [Chitinophagaceae bacterium]
MKIIVLGTEEQFREFRQKTLPEASETFFLPNFKELKSAPQASVIFDLSFEPTTERIETLTGLNKPVFINSLVNTLKELYLPQHIIRINAWPGFLSRFVVEAATGYQQQNTMAQATFQLLQWPYQIVPDTPGMVSARIIAMIINEAYFSLGEGVSSKQEIDTAMKLGTSYPLGPFEWSEKIGIKNIYKLLVKLNSTSNRYTVAPMLEKEASAF